MANVRDQVMQNTAGIGEGEEPTGTNDETTRSDAYGKTSGELPSTTPPARPPNANLDDIKRVESILGRTGGAANHPDGPGVGGD